MRLPGVRTPVEIEFADSAERVVDIEIADIAEMVEGTEMVEGI